MKPQSLKSVTLKNLQALLLAGIVSQQVAGANAPVILGGTQAFDGGMPNIGALLAAQNADSANAAPATLNPNYVALSSASAATWNLVQVPTGIPNTTIVRSGGAGLSDTLDYAWNIVNGIPGAYVGMTFPTLCVNLNSGTLTLVTQYGITLSGTTTISTLCARWYQGQITQVTTASGYVVAGITGGTYSQSNNLVTLTLTGNTASAPTVGQAIQLTPTSGALGQVNIPSWWAIVQQTSASSFIVWNPVSQTTSGNVNTFTTGTVAPNVFSPLLNFKGMFASVTGFTV